MVKRAAMLLLLLGVALAGCLTPTQDVPEGAIAFETIDQGQGSAIEEQRTVAIRDQHALVGLWDEHAPDETAPNVDFQRSMVAAAFKGESPDTCHHANVDAVRGQGDHVEVEAAFVVITGAACGERVTHPFHIVEIERHDAEIAFSIHEETRSAEDVDRE